MSEPKAIPFVALIDGKFNLTEEAKEFLHTVWTISESCLSSFYVIEVLSAGGSTSKCNCSCGLVSNWQEFSIE